MKMVKNHTQLKREMNQRKLPKQIVDSIIIIVQYK